jgi:hemerythrin-like domain-containing protein
MMEHRLIEKMLALADRKVQAMTEESYDPVFVDSVVDFIKTYADRTHHGKEENILFAELAKKDLDEANARILVELIDEHKQAREKVAEIVALNACYKQGERQAAITIKAVISWLASFYPVHIKKEDDAFFPDTERYFSAHELDELLERFWNFDRHMIHEKYRDLFDTLNA